MKSLTKAQMAEQLAALRAENSALRAQIDTLRAENAERWTGGTNPRYPLVDRLGRHYRMEGRVKCYQPS